MRTRLLVSVAALAATLLLPAAASAALVRASASYATPVDLTWDPDPTATTQTLYRADGPCAALPMFPRAPLTSESGGPPLVVGSWSDPVPDGDYCYYVEYDVGIGGYSNSLDVTVDTTAPTVTLGGIAANAKVRGTVPLTASVDDGSGSGAASVAFEIFDGSWTPLSTDTSAPFTASWDTTGLNGTYAVRAIATDQAGHPSVADTATNITVDNTAPTVTLGGIATNAKVRGTVPLTASADDGAGTGIASVAFEIFDGTWNALSTDSSAPFAASWDTTGLNGTYQVRAIATDLVGNPSIADTASNVLVDNTAPTVTLGGIATNAKVRGTVPLTASVNDGAGSGAASVSFETFNGTWTPLSTDNSAPFTASWDTTGLNGTYQVRAIATDVAGNPSLADTAINITVDNTVPTVALGGIATNAKVRGTVPLTASADDGTGSGVASVAFERFNGTWGAISTDSSAPFTASWNTTGLNGIYQVRATATDGAGNVSPADTVVNVTVDNTVPTPPGTPTTNFATVSATPQISFTGSTDPTVNGATTGVDHYDVYRTDPGHLTPLKVNAAPINGLVAGPYSFTDASATTQNTYTYTVVAVDGVGNQSNASPGLAVFVDPAAVSSPTGVTALANPTSQLPQVSWTAPASPGFTIARYNVYRDTGPSPVGIINAPTTTFTDSGITSGTYSYRVVAVSNDGVPILGVPSAAVTVVYDTVAPSAPGAVTAAAALDGSVAISWAAASDGAGSGISRYVVRRSLSSSAPVSVADGDATCQGLFTACGDATTLNGKLYSYSVFAVDAVGNTSPAGSSAAVTARDQLAPGAPKGLVATPGDASVDLRWSAAGADDDVAGYVLVAKQGTAAPASEADGTRVCTAIVAGSTACSASGLTNGATYTFGLFALDEALNRSQAAVVSAAPNGKVTDVKAPAAVTALKAKISGTQVTLTWKNPSDRDFDHVVITASERKPSARAAARRVYSGKGTKATTKVAAGEVRWFTVVAYDAVGNASPAATVRVKLAPPSLFGPEPRAKVHGKVHLSWPVAKGAKYYNVQVFAGKKRILVSWPAGRALQLPKAKLKRGTTYTWYVWPGLGAKAKAHYGKLIGKNTFTFAG
jgi:fibronectin type 3 domain-containing protein